MQKLIRELAYLGFEVVDVAGWERFAADVLGLTASRGPAPGSRLLRMDARLYRILLLEGAQDDCAFAGWSVADAQALEAFARHLDEQNVTWKWATDAELGLRCIPAMLHFQDPEGNRHEVFYGLPIADSSFVSPVLCSPFVTGEEGLGHVVYAAKDSARLVEFAQRVLQFSMSDTIRGKAVSGATIEVSFLHANTRHHSFAVAPARPGVAGKRIHHFMLEVESIEEVGLALDRCIAGGYVVTSDLGQHPNDRMISFYAQTPAGFHVEFGYGGVKVNDEQWQVVSYDRFSSWGHRPRRLVGDPATNQKQRQT